MKTYLPLLLPLLLAASAVLCAAEIPARTWTGKDGRTMTGTYLHGDGVTVWIDRKPGGKVGVPLADLVLVDQTAVKALQSDFAWKLPSARWPQKVEAPATRPALEDSKQKKGKMQVFRTMGAQSGFGFEFRVDQVLTPQQVGEFGRTFEASIELFKLLPWDIRPAPPEGKHYLARLYENRLDFTTALNVKDEGSSRVLGLYRHGDRTIHAPLETLLGGRSASNATLRHELAHQMMHDMLPLMPWWVAEGTAEYIRIIPWDGRGVYLCSAINSPGTLKRLAAEGEMNEQAFGEMLSAGPDAPQEAQMGQHFASAHGTAQEELLRIRKSRADQRAGKAPDTVAAGRKQKAAVQYGTVAAFASPFQDEGQATVLKYHAAKLLVYYLQHLEGDGKGARMLQLMWHLRQWADEMNLQRARFAKEAEQFPAAYDKYHARAKDFDKMEAAYAEDYVNWLRTNTGKPTDSPKPLAPEEELLKLLPAPPEYTAFMPHRIQARWTEIRNKTIGEKPESYYQAILDAFKAKKIELPVLEGDPRTVRPKPLKVIIK